MNSFEKQNTRKNTKISFRTDDLTLAKLKAICRIDNKTISALIENVLTEHVLCQENPMPQQGEKRLSSRKKCSISAVISSKDEDKKIYYKCTIVNLSTSSIQIILKKWPHDHQLEKDFFILFTLPDHELPLLVECQFVRASYIHDECIIIALFEWKNKLQKETLQKFLTRNDFLHGNAKKNKMRLS